MSNLHKRGQKNKIKDLRREIRLCTTSHVAKPV